MADARSGSHHSLLDLALLQTSRGATAQGCGTRAGLTTTKVPSSAEVGDPDPIRQRSSNPAQMRPSQAETSSRPTVGDGLKMAVAGQKLPWQPRSSTSALDPENGLNSDIAP